MKATKKATAEIDPRALPGWNWKLQKPRPSDFYSDPFEELRVRERQLNNLTHRANLLRQAADALVRHRTRVLRQHVEDERINLARQVAHDREGRHVHGNTHPRRELRLIDLCPASHDVPRPGGRFHDEPLLVQLAQDLTDDLPDALERLQVLLGLVVPMFVLTQSILTI